MMPLGHVIIEPDSHESKPHCPPGHASEHLEPAAQVAWHGGERHVKSHVLFAPQVQAPSAHVPVQVALSPAQVTLHGPDWHVKVHALPAPQLQSPSAQVPSHSALLPAQFT